MRRFAIFLCSLLLTASCAAPLARAQELPSSPTGTDAWTSLTSTASSTPSETASPTADPSATPTATDTPTETPSATPSPSATPTDTPTDVPTPTSTPTVASLAATVGVRFLSCRYGPGPEYLYLYALRGGANIQLIGRTDGDNWHWAWVAGRNPCWVNTSYLVVQGDWRQLPIVYPGTARLPVSPYYPPSAITSVVRHGNQVTVEWLDIPLRAGDEEDDSMQHYIVETWRCQGGTLLFEPLATNDTFMTILDEPGCTQPSHGRLFVQEKHGFSGPSDIPWPPAP